VEDRWARCCSDAESAHETDSPGPHVGTFLRKKLAARIRWWAEPATLSPTPFSSFSFYFLFLSIFKSNSNFESKLVPNLFSNDIVKSKIPFLEI
jgi:hypothetical protein